MEARVARLEAQFDRIEKLLTSLDDRIRQVEINIGELKGRASHLPSTWAMITTVIGGQVATIGMVAALFKLVFPH